MAVEEIDALRAVGERLRLDFGLTAYVATEIEFYLNGIEAHSYSQTILDEIVHHLRAVGISMHELERERGHEQFEIALLPTANLGEIAAHTELLKEVVTAVCAPYKVQTDFSAKPFVDRPGNGLHVHVHLEDVAGRNVFYREGEDEPYSRALLHALGGMTATLGESMPIFAPSPQSYSRFVANQNAPVTVSWGPNNRTVAIRLPQKPLNNKHIEHRVAGSNASPALTVAAILAGIHYGLSDEIYPDKPVFGDASLPMYGLEQLPSTWESALEKMQQSVVLSHYLGDTLFKDLLRRMLYPTAF